MPKGTGTCNNILALIYNATPWANIADNAASSPITNIYLALATVTGAASDTMSTNEATYTNYVRVTVARTTGGWTAPSGGATSNAVAVEYAACGVTGNAIVAGKTGVATGASAVLHYGDLNDPIAVSLQIQPRFPIGAITITES